MELNLENPIFVVYLNVGEMTRQRADEKIAELSNYMSYLIEVISNGTDDATIKQQLRNLQLKKIIDDDTSI